MTERCVQYNQFLFARPTFYELYSTIKGPRIKHIQIGKHVEKSVRRYQFEIWDCDSFAVCKCERTRLSQNARDERKYVAIWQNVSKDAQICESAGWFLGRWRAWCCESELSRTDVRYVWRSAYRSCSKSSRDWRKIRTIRTVRKRIYCCMLCTWF